MADSEIESKPPPPVSSLRSRFEQLGVGPVPTLSNSQSSLGLLSAEPTSPRQRAVSGSHEERPQYSTSHLRSASSSSDLKSGAKRPPPPPPPPRGLKPTGSAPSPAPSPLLRPTQLPNSTPTMSNIALLGSSPGKSTLAPPRVDDGVVPSTPPQGGVASLRNIFS